MPKSNIIDALADGVQGQHPSVIGLNVRKTSREVALIVADVLRESIIKGPDLMPDKLPRVSKMKALEKFNTHTEWSNYSLDSFEQLDLDDVSLERQDFKDIIKELIGLANFWKLGCSL